MPLYFTNYSRIVCYLFSVYSFTVRWTSNIDTWPIDQNKVLPARQNIDEVQNFSARWRLRFVLHWNKTFGESWRRFSASLPVEIFSMWVSKVAKNSVQRRCSFEIMPDANEMQRTKKEPTGSMFFIQKTSRLAGGFNFVRIDLKLSVKVGTIFLRLRWYYFSFKWDFWRRRKCPRWVLCEGGLSSPKQSPQ